MQWMTTTVRTTAMSRSGTPSPTPTQTGVKSENIWFLLISSSTTLHHSSQKNSLVLFVDVFNNLQWFLFSFYLSYCCPLTDCHWMELCHLEGQQAVVDWELVWRNLPLIFLVILCGVIQKSKQTYFSFLGKAKPFSSLGATSINVQKQHPQKTIIAF